MNENRACTQHSKSESHIKDKLEKAITEWQWARKMLIVRMESANYENNIQLVGKFALHIPSEQDR